MTRRLLAVCSLVVAGLATSASTASAVGISGQVNFVPFGTINVAGGGSGLGNITSVTFPATKLVNGPGGTGDGIGDYSIILSGDPVMFSSNTFSIMMVNGAPFAVAGPTVTFGPGGRFTYTPTAAQVSATAPDINGSSSLTYASTGLVVDSMLGGYDPTVSSFSFTLNQPTLVGPINGSFGIISPAVPLQLVPEPASLALVGVAVAGVAARRLRRKA